MARSLSGNRSVPHTADVRVEAWAPTREGCIAQAVHGAVRTFVEPAGMPASSARSFRLEDGDDEDLLLAVLEEMVYLLDTAGEVPVEVRIEESGEGVEVWFGMVVARTLRQVGAVPKAVSLHELRLSHGRSGWSCSVTLDV